jgi:hypothetical protein
MKTRTPRGQIELLVAYLEEALRQAPRGTDAVLLPLSRRQLVAFKRVLAGQPLDTWAGAKETEQ